MDFNLLTGKEYRDDLSLKKLKSRLQSKDHQEDHQMANKGADIDEMLSSLNKQRRELYMSDVNSTKGSHQEHVSAKIRS